MEYTVIALLTTSFVMSVIILAILALHTLFPKALPPKHSYIIWLIVLIGLIVPFRPIFGNGMIKIPLPALVQEQPKATGGMEAAGTGTPGESEPLAKPSQNQAETGISNIASVNDAPDSTSISPLAICMMIWGIIAFILFSIQIWRYIRFIRMVQRWGTPADDESLVTLFRAVQAQVGLEHKQIDLKVCSFVSSSMLTGFIHPVILLPEKHFDEDELELIFRHELIHLKRHDLAVKLLTVTATCLHWFNPLIYWLCAELQTDGEIACDEAVLQDADLENRRFYGEVIIGMIGKKDLVRTKFSTCFYAGKSNIKRRLDSIMDTKKKMKRPAVIAIAAVVVLTLSSGSVFAFSRSMSETNNHPDINMAVSDVTDNAVSPDANTTNLSAASEITAEDARQIALARTGGGTVTQCKQDYENGRKVYEVEIIDGDKKYEIDVDVLESTIIGDKVETLVSASGNNSEGTNMAPAVSDDSITSGSGQTTPDSNENNAALSNSDQASIVTDNTDSNASSEITAEDAKQIALVKTGGGTVTECKIDYEDGRKVYEIEIVNGDKKYEIDVDVLNSVIVKYDAETISSAAGGSSHSKNHHYDHDDDYDDDDDD